MTAAWALNVLLQLRQHARFSSGAGEAVNHKPDMEDILLAVCPKLLAAGTTGAQLRTRTVAACHSATVSRAWNPMVQAASSG